MSLTVLINLGSPTMDHVSKLWGKVETCVKITHTFFLAPKCLFSTLERGGGGGVGFLLPNSQLVIVANEVNLICSKPFFL